MTLREQILARIDATPYRPPSIKDFIYATHELFHTIQRELASMLAAGIIDTENGDSGLTYTRRKVYFEPAPSPHAPAPMPNTAHSGLAYFPSKNPNAQPVFHAKRSPSERKTLAACRVPRPQTKAELSAQAKSDRAAKVVKKIRSEHKPPDRTSQANRALVSKHLTHPMSAAQFSELAGMKEVAARSMLLNLSVRGFVRSDGQKQPKLYFFERTSPEKLTEFRAHAQKFKARRGLDLAAICAEYSGGAKMKELAQKWKLAEATISEILGEQGVKRRGRGDKLRGIPRAETALRAEKERLKARVAELESRDTGKK